MTEQTKQPSGVTVFRNYMDRLMPQLALVLPKHMNAERMARLAVTAFSTNPKLQECDQTSIAASLMTAGQLGLEPGVNGAGWLIPYKRICTFVPGWKGLVDLVSRSGRGTVFTGVIMKDQRYTFTDGARRDLVIHNETDLEAPEDITHGYAIGWVRDSSMPIIELWTVGKIRKHRDKFNKVGTSHYSYTNFEMYCRKVPLLQVLKYMPSSIELSNAIEVSNASESGRGATIENGIVIDMGGQFGHNAEEVSGEKVETQKHTEKVVHEVKEHPVCTPEQFVEFSKECESLVRSGKKKAAAVIKTAITAFAFTEEQKFQIDAWQQEGN